MLAVRPWILSSPLHGVPSYAGAHHQEKEKTQSIASTLWPACGWVATDSDERRLRTLVRYIYAARPATPPIPTRSTLHPSLLLPIASSEPARPAGLLFLLPCSAPSRFLQAG